MKKSVFVVLVLAFSQLVVSQDISGDWNAALNAGGQELPLIFHITQDDTGYSGTMDSPNQGANGIPLSEVGFTENTLSINIARLGILYSGTLNENGDIEGTFQQSGLEFPLNLTRGEATAIVQNRPQEPKAPYPYRVEEVTFENKTANLTLAATVTLPNVLFRGKQKLPAVILISGSGPQNRDEELLGHKPFLIIADYLTRQGIAVLRYDDRGTAQSTGDFSSATSADFATDAQAAFEYLKSHPDIDPTKIGFAGHSEGGIIAPMVAAMNKEVAFISLLAGVGQPSDELLLDQGYLIAKAQGATEDQLIINRGLARGLFKIIKTNTTYNADLIKNEFSRFLTEYIAKNPEVIPTGIAQETFIDQQLNTVATKWFHYFLNYNPAPILQQVSCPVFAVNGSLDLQVPAKKNLSAIEAALKKGGNTNVTTVEIPNLNHLFQTAKTGSPSEYANIEETFSPKVLSILGEWIKDTVE